MSISVISKRSPFKDSRVKKKKTKTKNVRCLTECFSHHTSCLALIQNQTESVEPVNLFSFPTMNNIIAVLLQLYPLETSWGTFLVNYLWGRLLLNQSRRKWPRSPHRTFTISQMSQIALRRFSRAGWTKQPGLYWALTVL